MHQSTSHSQRQPRTELCLERALCWECMDALAAESHLLLGVEVRESGCLFSSSTSSGHVFFSTVATCSSMTDTILSMISAQVVGRGSEPDSNKYICSFEQMQIKVEKTRNLMVGCVHACRSHVVKVGPAQERTKRDAYIG